MDENTKFTPLVVWKKLVLFFLIVICFLRYLGVMVDGVTGACPFSLPPEEFMFEGVV